MGHRAGTARRLTKRLKSTERSLSAQKTQNLSEAYRILKRPFSVFSEPFSVLKTYKTLKA